jgi:hypothetical protein
MLALYVCNSETIETAGVNRALAMGHFYELELK